MSPSNRQVTKDISSLKGNLLRKGSGVSVNLRCTDRQISSSPRCSPHHVVFRCHFCNAEQVHMADQAMFPLIAPVRRSMRRWLRDLFDTSRPYTGDGGLVMDMSPSILGRYSPLMPSFLIEHEPGFCGSLRQNLNHEFLGGSKQLFWCQKHIKIIKNPLCLARCSRASHDPSLPWCAMWEAESVVPPGVLFIERGRFRQSLGAWNRGLATSLVVRGFWWIQSEWVDFHMFFTNQLMQAQKENVNIPPYLLPQIQLTFCVSSTQIFTSKKLFPRLLARLPVL